jgi:DNA adenine methylase
MLPKPLVSWAGGKRRLLKYLLPLIPPHTGYVEAFGGGGAMLFAKDPSPVEVFNDINGELINLMRQVKYHPQEMLLELTLTPNSRELFKLFLGNPGLTEIQRAARFLMINRWSFGGMSRNYGTSKTSAGSAGNLRKTGVLANISDVCQRLDRVNIENEDWRKLISRYDAEKTFFFFDPPYTECGTTSYEPWNADTMQEFRNALRLLKGRWLLTVNDSPSIREIFQGLHIRPVARPNGIERRAGKIKNPIYHELIITP